jgi:hypothetical protein
VRSTEYAEAAIAALTGEGHDGKIYELAGDDAYALSDLAAEVSRQTAGQFLTKTWLKPTTPLRSSASVCQKNWRGLLRLEMSPHREALCSRTGTSCQHSSAGRQRRCPSPWPTH